MEHGQEEDSQKAPLVFKCTLGQNSAVMKTCELVTSHTAFCPGPQLAKCSPPKGFSRENSMEILMGGGATWPCPQGREHYVQGPYKHTQQNIHNLTTPSTDMCL